MSATAQAETGTDLVLDSALDLVLAFGVRNLTMSAIAKRAGMSRTTLYRRYPDVGGLVRSLMEREFGALIDDVASDLEGDTARERIANALAEATWRMRAHPFIRQVVTREADLMIPYIVERLGGTQRLALDLITRQVEDGQAEGSVRAGDPGAIAFSLLLILESFLLSMGLAEDVGEDAMLGELRVVLLGAMA